MAFARITDRVSAISGVEKKSAGWPDRRKY
jgi:hypothetical protein